MTINEIAVYYTYIDITSFLAFIVTCVIYSRIKTKQRNHSK